MQVHFRTITTDPLARYYTESSVGTLLIESMDSVYGGTIVDLGSGDGALVKAAAKVWCNSRFVTVDIDSNACNAVFPVINGSNFAHHTLDALDLSLAERIGLTFGEVDAAICNPPYLRPKWEKHFSIILEDAGLSHVMPRINEATTDLLFVAQNIRLLRDGGQLGLIIPDGIICGEKFGSFRKTLAEQHCIRRVIELPPKIFKNTEAKTFILVLEKSLKPDTKITLNKLHPSGVMSNDVGVDIENAYKRLDYSFYANKIHEIHNSMSIGDVTVKVTRGLLSSSEKRMVRFPVFHTTDYCDGEKYVPKCYKLANNIKNVRGVIASKGDILVARVGRNLNRKICMVNSGKVAITDCIILLKVLPEFTDSVFRYLCSERGRQDLDTISHGVGAKFLTIQGLLALKFK